MPRIGPTVWRAVLWAVVRLPSVSGFMLALLFVLVYSWLSAAGPDPQIFPMLDSPNTAKHTLVQTTHAGLHLVY